MTDEKRPLNLYLPASVIAELRRIAEEQSRTPSQQVAHWVRSSDA